MPTYVAIVIGGGLGPTQVGTLSGGLKKNVIETIRTTVKEIADDGTLIADAAPKSFVMTKHKVALDKELSSDKDTVYTIRFEEKKGGRRRKTKKAIRRRRTTRRR
jgi:hypothetical protein